MRLLCLGAIAIAGDLPSAWPVPGCINPLNNDQQILFNWEVPIGETLNPRPRPGGGPRIITTPNSIQMIQNWSTGGIASLATNHILDAGNEGLIKTLHMLQEHGLRTIGTGITETEISMPFVWKTGEGKLGLVNWVFPETHPELISIPGPNYWPGFDGAKSIISDLKTKVDWILAILHWSDEEFSYPMPEDREIADKLVQMGVDLIIGHHPHVVRGVDIIQGSPVFYSLGNYFFSNFRDASGCSISHQAPRNREALGVELIFNKGKKPRYQLHSFFQKRNRTIVDPFQRAYRRVRSVSSPLVRFQGTSYKNWYFQKRRVFDTVGIRLHFRLWHLGLNGLLRLLVKKLHFLS